MKVVIRNFGRVTSADIMLNGITVIAGANGSGKSTISRVLMTWISYLRQIDANIASERVKSIRESLNKIFAEADLPMLSSRIYNAQRKILSRQFWSNQKEVADLLVNNLYGRIEILDLETLSKLKAKVDNVYGQVYAAVEKVLNTADEPYEFYIANSFFRRAFDDQVGTFFDLSAESSVDIVMDSGGEKSATFCLGKCATLGSVRGNHIIPTFYIEPRHLIDSYASHSFVIDRNSRYVDNRFSCGEEFGWMRILYTNPEIDLWSMERAEQQEEINKELDKIVHTLLHGQIEKENRDIRFQDYDTGAMISIRNIASGAKTMAALIRGMRNGVIGPGSLLIIDEPETNLHPEWQVKVAEFLVLLNAKFGIRSLLNTHSPHFLKAIQVYSDLLGVGDRCRYYMMMPDEAQHRFKTKDITDNVEPVFEAMSMPYAKLVYGEKYGDQMGKVE